MIVVFDASTFVSAALKANSLPERALLRAVTAPNRLLLSQAIEDEYREVIFRPKFDRFVAVERRQRILDMVVFAADRVEPTETVRECRDPKDDKSLALAAAGCAGVIVSCDVRHLLSMHPWHGIAIVSAANFLALPWRGSHWRSPAQPAVGILVLEVTHSDRRPDCQAVAIVASRQLGFADLASPQSR